MPVDDDETPTRLERVANGACESCPVWHAVKGVRHENEIGRLGKLGEIESVARNERAIYHAAFGKPQPRDFQQAWIDVDSRYMVGDLGDLDGELTIARTQVNDFHAGTQTDSG